MPAIPAGQPARRTYRFFRPDSEESILWQRGRDGWSAEVGAFHLDALRRGHHVWSWSISTRGTGGRVLASSVETYTHWRDARLAMYRQLGPRYTFMLSTPPPPRPSDEFGPL